LLKKVNKAVRDHDLIEDGDGIVVVVSGGKDTVALLKLLNVRRPLVREDYDLVAVRVQSDLDCGGTFSVRNWKSFSTPKEWGVASRRCAWRGKRARVESNRTASGALRTRERSPLLSCKPSGRQQGGL